MLNFQPRQPKSCGGPFYKSRRVRFSHRVMENSKPNMYQSRSLQIVEPQGENFWQARLLLDVH